MIRSRVFGLLFLSLLVSVLAPVGARPAPFLQILSEVGEKGPAADVYHAYVAGSHDAVPRVFGDRSAYVAIQRDLRRLIDYWRTPLPESRVSVWTPSRASFLLEGAAAAKRIDPAETVSLLESMRTIVAMRRIPRLGAAGPDDRWEVAVHRVAVVLLSDAPKAAADYLDRISGRINDLRQLGGAEFVAPLVLARAVAADAATLAYPTGRRPVATATGPVPADVRDRNTSLMLAERDRVFATGSRAYGDAVQLPSVAAEANVRRGFLLFRWDRPAEALAAIDRGLAAAANDVDVRYLALLFRGRVLVALGRMAEGQQSYERAVQAIPAQAAATALAAMLVIDGRAADAEMWASRARAQDPRASDPWQFYWLGDARLGDVLWRQVREARP